MWYSARNRRQDDRDEQRQAITDMVRKMRPLATANRHPVKWNSCLQRYVEVR